MLPLPPSLPPPIAAAAAAYFCLFMLSVSDIAARLLRAPLRQLLPFSFSCRFVTLDAMITLSLLSPCCFSLRAADIATSAAALLPPFRLIFLIRR